MVKTFEDGSSVAPFLLKCYEIVDDESTDSLISWSESYGNSFIIWDVAKFQYELLPKYFKHSNFSSFIRQLNIYGFRKSDTDRWEFSNDEFVKGQKHLLKNIIRRKQTQVQGQRKSSRPKETEPSTPEEDKRIELSKEVENLKTDKNALMQELAKLQQKQQISQSKLIVVRDQLKGMEKNQQQMLSFIVMAMQNPGFFVQLLQPKVNNWCTAETGNKNVISEVSDDCEPEPISFDKLLVRYELPVGEASEPPCSITTSDPEMLMEWDPEDMRDLLLNIDLSPGPLDEKLLPLENQEPVILRDIPDGDAMLEQLLLSSPPTENMETEELDSETSTDPGIQLEPAFHAEESDNFTSLEQE